MADDSSTIVFYLICAVIFPFLMFSCHWFNKSMRQYNQERREFEEQQQRNSSGNIPSYRFSVYTVENGRRTLVNYGSNMPPSPNSPSAPRIIMEHELPPSYDVAIKMHKIESTPNTSESTEPPRTGN
ncbi:CLUMA_CG016575, isoform A [Clunio marinus]|uniref:CLUMA_CG016575, isoform A n=1 Tax=Clunio marinus TaxID=568069 RepID=A0A1J1IUR7_9DIPT|nr:CLUMA_CG016575, isoform A [Clunio marinus]